MGEKLGLAAAVRELVGRQMDRARLPDGSLAPHQLPLLPVSEAEEADQGSETTATVLRGPGRPKGARNLSTEALREAYLTQFRHPLWVLGSAYTRPLELLREELGCTKYEAYRIQQDAAIAALPYLAQKQPTAIDLGDAKVVQLVINTGNPADPRSGAIDGEAFEAEILPVPTIEQNQGVGDAAATFSPKRLSPNQAQASEPTEQSAAQAPDQSSGGTDE